MEGGSDTKCAAPHQALGGLRVLDLSESVAGQYCGRLLADYGAAVTLLEPPSGSVIRAMPPFDPALGSVAFFHLNLGKQLAVLDLQAPDGRRRFLETVAATDVVLVGPGADRVAIRQANPRCIIGVVSGFGEDGPYRDWKGAEMLYQALSGMMNNNGQAGRKPLFGCGDRASYGAGLAAYISTLTALHARATLGLGQDFEVDVAETTSAMAYPFVVQHAYNGSIEPRGGRNVPLGKVLCGNDWVCFWIQFHRWEAACRAIDAPELIADPRFGTHGQRLANWPDVVAAIQDVVRDWSADDLVQRWQAARMNAARAYRLSELAGTAHLRERGFWETVDTADGERIILGPPFRLGATPRQPGRPARPAMAEAIA